MGGSDSGEEPLDPSRATKRDEASVSKLILGIRGLGGRGLRAGMPREGPDGPAVGRWRSLGPSWDEEMSRGSVIRAPKSGIE